MTNEGVSFRVTPEALDEASGRLAAKMQQMRAALDEAQRIAAGTEAFWQGEAARAHRAACEACRSRFDEPVARLGEHVGDLNRIAGNYSFAERWNAAQAEALPDDIIV